MTPQELAENVKRLREYDFSPREGEDWPQYMGRARKHRGELLQTINTLVALVGEMHRTMETADQIGCLKYLNACDDAGEFWYETLTKSSPIAELAKEGEC